MAIWYFDSTMPDDSGDGQSPETARKSYNDFRVSNGGSTGDTFLFKRGTTHIISTANIDFKSGSSSTNRTIIGAYGIDEINGKSYATITPPPTGTLPQDFIINVSGRSNIDISDIYFDGLGRVSYSMYILATGATANSGHRISRCYFTGTLGYGLQIGGTATSTGDTSDYVIEDCHFFNNPIHGMLVNGAHGVIFRRCKFYGNGYNAPAGGHGFSSKYRLQESTPTGWVQNGNIWYRPLESYQTDVYYVKTNVTNYTRLNRKVGGDQTAPIAGEFGVTGGNLYINVNSTNNPSTQGVKYAWGRCYDILLEDCEAYGNFNDPASPYVEGHGFAFDNWVDDSTFRRCKSYNNEGAGFSINMGDRNTIESCIAYENLAAAVNMVSRNSKIRKNTFFNNNKGSIGTRSNGEISAFPTSANCEISSNILLNIGDPKYGVEIYAGITGFTGDKNCVYGYDLGVEQGSTLTNTVLVDPQLDKYHRPRNISVIGAGVNFGGRDFYNRIYHGSPTIGAVEKLPPTNRHFFQR